MPQHVDRTIERGCEQFWARVRGGAERAVVRVFAAGQQPHVVGGHAGAQVSADNRAGGGAHDDIGVVGREPRLHIERTQNARVIGETNHAPTAED